MTAKTYAKPISNFWMMDLLKLFFKIFIFLMRNFQISTDFGPRKLQSFSLSERVPRDFLSRLSSVMAGRILYCSCSSSNHCHLESAEIYQNRVEFEDDVRI